MSSYFVDVAPHMAYVDRHELLRSMVTEEEFRDRRQFCLDHSTTLYVGNLSFYTTEAQIHEHFSPCGQIREIMMGLNEESMTPCGFCFVVLESQRDAVTAVELLRGSLLDDRIISVGWDVGCDRNRRWGRGAHGGQVIDGVRQTLDGGRGGLGALRRDALGLTATLSENEVIAYSWVPPRRAAKRPKRPRGQ